MSYQIKDESIARLMENSQLLHGKLVASPLWEMLKTEPLIVSWIQSLDEVDRQMKPKLCNLCAEPEHLGPCHDTPRSKASV